MRFDFKVVERLLVEGFVVVSLLFTLAKIVHWEWRDLKRSISEGGEGCRCALMRPPLSKANCRMRKGEVLPFTNLLPLRARSSAVCQSTVVCTRPVDYSLLPGVPPAARTRVAPTVCGAARRNAVSLAGGSRQPRQTGAWNCKRSGLTTMGF
jgi:hypothetical protein